MTAVPVVLLPCKSLTDNPTTARLQRFNLIAARSWIVESCFIVLANGWLSLVWIFGASTVLRVGLDVVDYGFSDCSYERVKGEQIGMMFLTGFFGRAGFNCRY